MDSISCVFGARNGADLIQATREADTNARIEAARHRVRTRCHVVHQSQSGGLEEC
jgi:hypothetical protein